MGGITVEIAREKLNTWLEAEEALATSQSYTMGTMSLTRADLKQVRENITYWNDMVTKLDRTGKGRNRIYRGIPMD
jgi:hypothetical protein